MLRFISKSLLWEAWRCQTWWASINRMLVLVVLLCQCYTSSYWANRVILVWWYRVPCTFNMNAPFTTCAFWLCMSPVNTLQLRLRSLVYNLGNWDGSVLLTTIATVFINHDIHTISKWQLINRLLLDEQCLWSRMPLQQTSNRCHCICLPTAHD